MGPDGVAIEVLDDAAALVVLPEPDSPVNQSVKPPPRERSDSGCSCG